jgi:hypothetical protein
VGRTRIIPNEGRKGAQDCSKAGRVEVFGNDRKINTGSPSHGLRHLGLARSNDDDRLKPSLFQ